MSNTALPTSKTLRQLAPAPTLHGVRPGDPGTSKDLGPRRNLVKNACRICQSKKTKCDGKRPQCSRCGLRGLKCEYEALYEGMTKQQSAEYEINRLAASLAEAEQTLHILAHGTQEEAYALLAHIRQNAAIDKAKGGPPPDHYSPSSIYTLTETPSTESSTTAGRSFAPLLFNRNSWSQQPDTNHDPKDPNYAVAARNTADVLEDTLPVFSHTSQLVIQQPSGFGNLPFSSSIYTNHYPIEIQQQQHDNFLRPLHSMLPMSDLPGDYSVTKSISHALSRARSLLKAGQPLEHVIGKKFNVAAIYDPEQYKRASVLSKWAADFTFSIQHKQAFVSFASAHLVWTLARWMIIPSASTYEAVPEWLRPTELQLYVPHVEMLDFVLWPKLRDTLARNPDTLQKDWRWLHHLGQEIECDWFINAAAVETDQSTGETYLTDDAKVAVVEDIQYWSVGPSAGQYIGSLDQMMRVRQDTPYPPFFEV